jgi:hypothetical protein
MERDAGVRSTSQNLEQKAVTLRHLAYQLPVPFFIIK